MYKKIIIIILVFFVLGLIAYNNFYSKKSSENKKVEEKLTQQIPSSTINNDYLLPDLQILFPDNLYIQVNPFSGKKEIRFNSSIANLGQGPLEMVGTYDKEENKTRANQLIHRKDGSIEERFVGYFVFHSSHEHWHFEDFIEFELYSYKEDKSLDNLITGTGKITSCIFDSYPFASPIPNSPKNPQFPKCTLDKQGISIGWVDNYGPEIPGQQLDIENVPDGSYAFRLTVDPSKLILESDENNNSFLGYIEIEGFKIKMIKSP